jgi:hypothetical protein
VKEELAKNPDKAVAALADSELMFPTEATLSSLHIFGDLSEEEETKFDDRFAQITES